jgi:hypothetical protein
VDFGWVLTVLRSFTYGLVSSRTLSAFSCVAATLAAAVCVYYVCEAVKDVHGMKASRGFIRPSRERFGTASLQFALVL